MQVEIIIADDRQSAQVGDTKLVVGGPITFKTLQNKMVPGIIMAFAIIDKKDMKSPWCYARDIKGENAEWFPLRGWVEQTTTVQTPAPPPAPVAPVTEIPTFELSDDDML